MQKYRYGTTDVYNCSAGSCPGWERLSTIYGTCCAFNYHPFGKSSASVLNQVGILGGVNILFGGKDATSDGVVMIITKPGSFITHSSEMFHLIPGFDNFFRLHLIHDTYSSDYERLPVRLRRCFSASDGRPSLVFQSRCLFVCAAETAHDQCDCHPYFLPIIEPSHQSIRSCNMSDLICIRNKAGITMDSRSLKISFILW